MHIVILHGYILQGTGSNIYVVNIAKSWVKQGHSVTVICQDREAPELEFVSEYFGTGDEIPSTIPAPGTMRVIVPDINNLLPVYVFDRYEGYDVKTIPTMTENEIENHINMTAAALREVVRKQLVDRVFTNHAILSPVIAKRGLEGTGVFFDSKIHGSALEYTLVPYPETMKYAIEGLKEARHLVAGTIHIYNRVMEIFADHKEELNLEEKMVIVPPGMDPEIFRISYDYPGNQRRLIEKVNQWIQKDGSGRTAREVPDYTGTSKEEYYQKLHDLGETYNQRVVDADLPDRWPEIQSDEPIVIYFGKFLKAKGVGELLALAPFLFDRVPKIRFVLVGFGTFRENIEGMLQAFRDGDVDKMEACAYAGEFVEKVDVREFFRKLTEDELSRITVTGILDHERLKEILPLASICVVPSKLSEAFGMVAVEAMSAGVLPLCNYHSGMKDVVDELLAGMPELKPILPDNPDTFFEELPERIIKALDYIYPNGFSDDSTKRAKAEVLRKISVENFSWDGVAKKLLL